MDSNEIVEKLYIGQNPALVDLLKSNQPHEIHPQSIHDQLQGKMVQKFEEI